MVHLRCARSAASKDDAAPSSSVQESPKSTPRKRKAKEERGESLKKPTLIETPKKSTRKRKKKQKNNSEVAPNSEAGNNVQDPSGPTPRKRKAVEDPEEPTLFKAPQNTQRRRKRKLSNEATTSSEPSTSVQETSGSSSPRKRKAEEDTVGPSKKPQNLDASKKKKKKKKKKRRARRRRVANMQVNVDNNPEDHPVLAQRSSSIRELRAKYSQLDKIGQGGFGSVFAGVRKSDNLPVAIKYTTKDNMLFTTVVGVSGREYSFPSEVVLMLRAGGGESCIGLNGAVACIEWYDLENEVVIVMEKPEDFKDLRRYLDEHDGRLTEPHAKDLIRKVILATMDVFNKGVFHRDLKSENILVKECTDGFQVRIVDFGCSCNVEPIYEGMYAGTLNYIPPEVFKECQYRADATCVWQVGAVLWEILDSRITFSTIGVLEKKLRMHRGLSQYCAHFLNSCLTLLPMERLPLPQLLYHPWF